MGNDPPDKCATSDDVHMTAIGDNGLRINFEPGCNADVSGEKCPLCTKALVFDKDFVYPHCMFCNTCSLVNAHLDDSRSARNICAELDCGTTTMKDVNVHVQSLGKFIWSCHDCLNKIQVKEPLVDPTTKCSDSDTPSWFNSFSTDMLNSVTDLKKNFDSQINTLANELNDIKSKLPSSNASTDDFASPERKRKAPGQAWSAIPANNVCHNTTLDSIALPPLPIVNSKQRPVGDAFINLGSNALGKNAIKLLIDKDKEVPDFTSTIDKHGSTRLLFKNFSDAEKARNLLENQLNGAKIDKPILKHMTKIDLVGVPYCITKEEAITTLVRDNKDFNFEAISGDGYSIAVKNMPNCRMKVLSINRCKSGLFKLRMCISRDLKNLIGDNKLKVLKTVVHLYDVPWINICYRCQVFGHKAKDCTSNIVCGKCAEAHQTQDCESTQSCCNNCKILGYDDVAHHTFSRTCPVLRTHFKT